MSKAKRGKMAWVTCDPRKISDRINQSCGYYWVETAKNGMVGFCWVQNGVAEPLTYLERRTARALANKILQALEETK